MRNPQRTTSTFIAEGDQRMLRAAILAITFATAAATSMADNESARMSGDDVGVLEGAIRDLCMAGDPRVIVSDAPETRVHLRAHPDPMLERDFGAQLVARAAEVNRWPPSQPCGNVTIIPAARIQEYFDQTRRVPDDWLGLLKEFGADGCMTISRPAYSADRTRAAITTRYRYGELWKIDRVIELTRTVNGWRIVRSLAVRIE